MRFVQIILGLALTGGGGYLAWQHYGLIGELFPPAEGTAAWELIGGLAMLIVGIVLALAGIMSRSVNHARVAEQEAHRETALSEAENYYSDQAANAGTESLVADPVSIDAPSVDAAATEHSTAATLFSEPTQQAAPEPAPTPAPTEPNYDPLTIDPMPAAGGPAETFPASEPEPVASPANHAPAPNYMDTATPPTAPAAAPSPVAAAPISAATDALNFPDIRQAIADKRLDEADKLLTEQRKILETDEGRNSLELAELTGLAGDHANADGRLGSAKWLWRLSLQRFSSAGAISDPRARAVSENLRVSDQ